MTSDVSIDPALGETEAVAPPPAPAPTHDAARAPTPTATDTTHGAGPVCEHCGRPSLDLLVCTGCDAARFCDQACLNAAWCVLDCWGEGGAYVPCHVL